MIGDLRTLVVSAAAALFPAGSPVTAADRTWTEAKSTHFVVVSDAGEKAARNTLWQLEQLRIAYRSPGSSADSRRTTMPFVRHARRSPSRAPRTRSTRRSS